MIVIIDTTNRKCWRYVCSHGKMSLSIRTINFVSASTNSAVVCMQLSSNHRRLRQRFARPVSSRIDYGRKHYSIITHHRPWNSNHVGFVGAKANNYYYISSRIANESKLITVHCFWRANACGHRPKTLNTLIIIVVVVDAKHTRVTLLTMCTHCARGCPFKRNTNQNGFGWQRLETDLPHALCINNFRAKWVKRIHEMLNK